MRAIFLLFGLVLWQAGSVASAQGGLEQVEMGMEYHDVFSKIGSPGQKIEYESKREMKWFYPQGDILFREGKVVQVLQKELERVDTLSHARGHTQEADPSELIGLAHKQQPQNKVPVAEILSEILSAGSEETTEPDKKRPSVRKKKK